MGCAKGRMRMGKKGQRSSQSDGCATSAMPGDAISFTILPASVLGNGAAPRACFAPTIFNELFKTL